MTGITIQGRVPSKKNAWKRGGGGKAYLPAQIQADIEALEILARSERNKIPRPELEALHGARRIRVIAEFHVKKEVVDLDNAFTTLLDVLQKADIILNDKVVRSFGVDEMVEPDRDEHTCINFEVLA